MHRTKFERATWREGYILRLHTNFDIRLMTSLKKGMESIDGVSEVRWTGRYECIIYVGLLFNPEDVENKISDWVNRYLDNPKFYDMAEKIKTPFNLFTSFFLDQSNN